MKKKISLIGLVVVIVAIFAYFNFKATEVEITSPAKREFTKETVLTGEISFVNKSVVRSKISGDIKELLVKDGDTVEKDQVLLKIDSSEYYQNYSVIEQDITKAVSAIDEFIDTNRDNLGDPEVIHGREKLEIALSQAKSKRIASLIGFNDYQIIAPSFGRFYFSGTKDLLTGEYVLVNSEVGNIYNNDKLQVVVGFTPDELSSLEGVSTVAVHIDGYETEVQADISKIADTMGRNDNGDEVLFVTFNIIDDVDDIYKKDGLNAKVYIRNKTATVLGVPFTSVFSEKSIDYVYKVKNNKLVKTEVNVKDDFGEFVSVEEKDITEQDVIVTNVVEGLKDGKRVKIK